MLLFMKNNQIIFKLESSFVQAVAPFSELGMNLLKKAKVDCAFEAIHLGRRMLWQFC